MMILVFNELSVNDVKAQPGQSVMDAKLTIDRFVSCLQQMKNKKLLDVVISCSAIHMFYVSEDYGINEWLTDNDVKRTHKDFFRLMRNKNWNYIDANDYNEAEFRVNVGQEQQNAIGCIIAVQNDYHMISVESKAIWAKSEISGKYTVIDENANISTEERLVQNITGSTPISAIQTEVRSTVYGRISSGQDLWERRLELYPNLVFCENVKDLLYKDPEKYHIMKIMGKLDRLQTYFAEYNGIYDPRELGMCARTESETVKSNNDLMELRKFEKPDGEQAYFFDHIGFSGKFSGGRIHFLPQNTERKCYIGYIGRHLPTNDY